MIFRVRLLKHKFFFVLARLQNKRKHKNYSFKTTIPALVLKTICGGQTTTVNYRTRLSITALDCHLTLLSYHLMNMSLFLVL